MLEARTISKYFGKHAAAQEASFSVRPGEICGLIGENGSGKTTLIRCLAGIYRPDKGGAYLDDQKIYDCADAKERIAYISDEQGYMEQYIAREIVKLYRRFYPGFDAELFNRLNEEMQLDLTKTVKSFSKGQRMVFAFLLAVAQNADYFLMDEPMGGVDAKHQQLMKEILLHQMEQRGLGVLISSHAIEDLEKLCDSTVFLKKGKVIASGDVDAVVAAGVKKYRVTLSDSQREMLAGQKDICLRPQIGREYFVYASRETAQKVFALADIKNRQEITASLREVFLWENDDREELQ